jgi:hypothetical protein
MIDDIHMVVRRTSKVGHTVGLDRSSIQRKKLRKCEAHPFLTKKRMFCPRILRRCKTHSKIWAQLSSVKGHLRVIAGFNFGKDWV